MNYSDKTGLRISEIGVGCYSLSGVYGTKDRDEFARMVRRAYDLGVTFFDTAPAYGVSFGEAEEFVGSIVGAFRSDVCIATKVGVVSETSESRVQLNLSPSAIRASCDASLQRLGTDYIDLYQVHFDDGVTPIHQVVATLEDLKSAGKIRAWGVCHLPARRIAEYCENGQPFSVLMELSAVARLARVDLLPMCTERNVAGIAFSTTGRGILTGSIRPGHVFPEGDLRSYDPMFQREQFESAMRVAETMRQIAARYGKTPAQVAIAWVLGQAGVVCALTGPSTVKHLEENLGACGWRIPRDDADELERIFEHEEAWIRRRREESVRLILGTPAKPELYQAFADLIYVIETSVTSGLMEESDIVPIFRHLCELKDRAGGDYKDTSTTLEMDRIRIQLREMLAGSSE